MMKTRFIYCHSFLVALALTTSAEAFAHEAEQPQFINVADAKTRGEVEDIIVTVAVVATAQN